MRLLNIVKIGALLGLLSLTQLCGAEVKLSPIFGSGMVLQQNAEVYFRGTAKSNSKITLIASWNNAKLTTASDNEGKWAVAVPTPSHGGPYKIVISDGHAIILDNVLIGEVWLCSGQSNIEMPVKGFAGQPVTGSQEYIASASSRRAIRLYKQPRDWSTTEKTEIKGAEWSLCTAANVSEFSAVGYFFGEMLEKSIDIPVGIIQCAWSMSKIEAWMSRSTLERDFENIAVPDVNQKEFGWTAGTPTLLWNAMVKPWKGFPIKGVLWYQGEANSENPEEYKKLFPAMVKEWRDLFKNPDMPFYYVQIAPWKSSGEDNQDWAAFRQAQLELLDLVPNVGMVSTADIGDKIFIHCPKKIEVGKRLAYLALNNLYGYDRLLAMGPIAKKCVKDENGVVTVVFDNGQDGLTPENQKIGGFELVDKDGKILKADAEIVNSSNRVKVWNAEMPNPVEVRYNYRNYFEGELFNNAHLPASPFKMKIQ